MPLLDPLFSVGAFRKAIWKLWYPFLTRRLRDEEVLFLNYAFETAPPMAVPLAPLDEPNRSWERMLAAAPLKLVHSRIINAEVQRGMELNSDRSLALVTRHLPRFLHGPGRDFAGVRGARVHRALVQGKLSYRSYCWVKE